MSTVQAQGQVRERRQRTETNGTKEEEAGVKDWHRNTRTQSPTEAQQQTRQQLLLLCSTGDTVCVEPGSQSFLSLVLLLLSFRTTDTSCHSMFFNRSGRRSQVTCCVGTDVCLLPLYSLTDVTQMKTDDRQMRGGENGRQRLETRVTVCCVPASKAETDTHKKRVE